MPKTQTVHYRKKKFSSLFVYFKMALSAVYIYCCLLCIHRAVQLVLARNSVHNHGTRHKDNIHLKHLRLNMCRHGNNYYPIKLNNLLTSDIKSLQCENFKLIGSKSYF